MILNQFDGNKKHPSMNHIWSLTKNLPNKYMNIYIYIFINKTIYIYKTIYMYIYIYIKQYIYYRES